jgi:hypothetical protein
MKELEKSLNKMDFNTIGKCLFIIGKFLEFFVEFKTLLYIKKIEERLKLLKLKIFKFIESNFNRVFKAWIEKQKIDEMIKEVIEVIKILQPEPFLKNLRLEITKKYVFYELNKYKILFGNINNQTLDSFKDRFKWIKKFISKNEKFFKLFPHNWYFIQESITEFCLITLEVLKELLNKFSSEISILTSTILMTRRFENDMNRRYRLIIKTDLQSMIKEVEKKLIINEELISLLNARVDNFVQKKFILSQERKKLEKQKKC